MSWEKVKLGDIVLISKGKKHNEVDDTSASRYIQIEDLNGSYTSKFTNEKGVDVEKNDVIIAWDGANAGKVGTNLIGVIGSTLARLRPVSGDTDGNFLFRYMQLKESEIKSKRTGATIPHVNGAELRNMLIPLPPLPIQQKIAAILDQADALRKKDRQLLAKYDELLQAVFYDMFGDPVKNEKGWEKGAIRDVVTEVKYGTSKPAEESGLYPYLRMNNITYGGDWDFSNLKYINLEEKEKEKYLLRKNDLVFNRTNSKELVGKTAVYKLDNEMAIAGYLIRVRTNERANSVYLSAYLNSRHGKAVLMGMCKNIIGMANINAQELQDINILIPPISLQNQFAGIVHKIQQQKEKLKQHMAQSENLFQSLLQRAFKGELVKE